MKNLEQPWTEKVDLERGVTLYCGDCLDILPTLEGVDAVITDPPYGIGFKYENFNNYNFGECR